jgi:hypothetical protein
VYSLFFVSFGNDNVSNFFFSIQFLVCLVWILLTNMLYVFYTVITPQLYQTWWPNFLFHFFMGNLLAVNTFFHYTMGLFTGPGHPTAVSFNRDVVSFTEINHYAESNIWNMTGK